MSRDQRRSRLNAIANPLLTKLLRSPFHGLLSRRVMLITVVGRKSGTPYTTPVSYLRDGDTLIILSRADRRWWRNLRGGAPVVVRVAGRDVQRYAEVIEAPQAVASAVQALVRGLPAFRRRFGITFRSDGQPAPPERLVWLIQGRVVIRITGLNGADKPSEQHSDMTTR